MRPTLVLKTPNPRTIPTFALNRAQLRLFAGIAAAQSA